MVLPRAGGLILSVVGQEMELLVTVMHPGVGKGAASEEVSARWTAGHVVADHELRDVILGTRPDFEFELRLSDELSPQRGKLLSPPLLVSCRDVHLPHLGNVGAGLRLLGSLLDDFPTLGARALLDLVQLLS